MPFSPVLLNSTPLSMPSPSNQCASRCRSSLTRGLPPLRTYSPPASSRGISPSYSQGVRPNVELIGAKLPARYLSRVVQRQFSHSRSATSFKVSELTGAPYCLPSLRRALILLPSMIIGKSWRFRNRCDSTARKRSSIVSSQFWGFYCSAASQGS